MSEPKPSTWRFTLDDRTTHMSLVETNAVTGPVYATPDSINQLTRTFQTTEGTPRQVLELLDMSTKLLATSVIHYEFAAMGVEKSFQALELAIRFWLERDGKPTFSRLIRDLERSGRFTPSEIEMFNSGRYLRNKFSHPDYAAALPLVMAVNIIYQSYMLISVLFPKNDVS